MMEGISFQMGTMSLEEADKPELSPMSVLFNLCQSNKIDIVYEVVEESGPSHDKNFKVKVSLGPDEYYHGTGKSKLNAKRSAAQTALLNTKLKQQPSPKKGRKSAGQSDGSFAIFNVLSKVQSSNSGQAESYSNPANPTPNSDENGSSSKENGNSSKENGNPSGNAVGRKSKGRGSKNRKNRQSKTYVQTPRSELNRIAQERGIALKVNTTEEEVIEDAPAESVIEVARICRIMIAPRRPEDTDNVNKAFNGSNSNGNSNNNNNSNAKNLNNGQSSSSVDERPIAAPDFSKRNNKAITKVYRTTIELMGQTFSCKSRTKQSSVHSAATEALNFLHTQSPLPALPCMYNSLILLNEYASRNRYKLDLQCDNINGSAHLPLFKAVYSLYDVQDWKKEQCLMSAEGFGKCKKTAKFEAASNLLDDIEKSLEEQRLEEQNRESEIVVELCSGVVNLKRMDDSGFDNDVVQKSR